MGDEQWYTNKDLFEMIQKLMAQMARTEQIIAKYNGLHEKVQGHDKYIQEQQGQGQGRKSIEEAIIRWGGWIVGFTALVISILKLKGCS